MKSLGPIVFSLLTNFLLDFKSILKNRYTTRVIFPFNIVLTILPIQNYFILGDESGSGIHV